MQRLSTLFVLCALIFTGCQSGQRIDEAIAVVNPTQGNRVHGIVHFTQTSDGVLIEAHLSGLNPNSTHAFHIHEFGDASALDGKSAGGHYNPAGHDHSLPDTEKRHAGDLGNLKADANGKANLEMKNGMISISGPVNPVLGRSVIIHAKADDGGQPTGNAGARVGMGVIGIANP